MPSTLIVGERMELSLFLRNLGSEPFPSSTVILELKLGWKTNQTVLVSYTLGANRQLQPGEERQLGPNITNCMSPDFTLVDFRIISPDSNFSYPSVIDEQGLPVEMIPVPNDVTTLVSPSASTRVKESKRAVSTFFGRGWNEVYSYRVFRLSAITAAAAATSLALSLLVVLTSH